MNQETQTLSLPFNQAYCQSQFSIFVGIIILGAQFFFLFFWGGQLLIYLHIIK